MHRLIGILVVTLLLVGVTPTAAQLEGQASCVVWEDGAWSQAAWLTFEQCVDRAVAQQRVSPMNQGLAVWGQYRINVRANGDVYWGYSDRGRVNQWNLWGATSSGSPTSSSGSGVDDVPTGLRALLAEAEDDIHEYWTGVFRAGGLTYEPPAGVHVYYGEEETPCGPTIPDNAFYCMRDQSIYLDWGLMNSELREFGEFGPMVVLAHEWGHAVQDYLGKLSLGRNWSISLELQADCFAGSYARYAVDESGAITIDDAQEGAASLYDKGDNLPWTRWGAHGTPDQRSNAFNQGYQGGVHVCYGLAE